MNNKSSKKKSKNKNKVCYKDWRNADFEMLKGIPKDLVDSSYRKKFQLGYLCQATREMVLTKFFFDNVEFDYVANEKMGIITMPITPNFTREQLEIIGEILSCNEIRPCFVVDTYKEDKHIHNFNMALCVKYFVVAYDSIALLVQF